MAMTKPTSKRPDKMPPKGGQKGKSAAPFGAKNAKGGKPGC